VYLNGESGILCVRLVNPVPARGHVEEVFVSRVFGGKVQVAGVADEPGVIEGGKPLFSKSRPRVGPVIDG
jgi:hypothetical protein